MERLLKAGLFSLAMVFSALAHSEGTQESCETAVSGPIVWTAELEGEFNRLDQLFSTFMNKDLGVWGSVQADDMLLRVFAHSTHPMKIELFGKLYVKHSGKKKLNNFERVALKVDKPDPVPSYHMVSIEARTFLRAAQYKDARLEKIPDWVVEPLVAELTKLSPNDRLIVFREAVTEYFSDRANFSASYYELLWEVVNRVGDPTLINLVKKNPDLNKTYNLDKNNVKSLIHDIEHEISKPTFKGFVSYAFKNSATQSGFVNMLLIAGYVIGGLCILGGTPTSLLYALSIFGGTLATSTAIKAMTYQKYYPTGKAKVELRNDLQLHLARNPQLAPAIEVFKMARQGKTRSVVVRPVVQVPAEPLAIPVSKPVQANVDIAKPVDRPQIPLDEILKDVRSLNFIPERQPLPASEGSQYKDSWSRFKNFFGTLKRNAVGRDDLIQTIEHSLLAGERQNILLLGSTGVGKSFLADALGAIRDRNNPQAETMFKLLMTPETTRSEVDGPLNYAKTFERLTEYGILNFAFGFMDEIFDYPRVRNLLNALEEGVLRQGAQGFKGKLQFAIAATNKYITEIYQILRGNNAQAPQDRFAHIYVVANELSTVAENLRLMNLNPEPLPEFYIQDLEALRPLIDQVSVPLHVELKLLYLFQRLKAEAAQAEHDSRDEYEKKLKAGNKPEAPPYRSTRVYSNRSLKRGLRILKTIVAYDWLKRMGSGEQSSLEAKSEHLLLLENYFCLGGPKGVFLRRLISQTLDPLERQQYEIVEKETERFQSVMHTIETELTTNPLNVQLTAMEKAFAEGRLQKSEKNREDLNRLAKLSRDLEVALRDFEKNNETDGQINAQTVILPSLQSRFNKLIAQLGM